MKFWIIFGAIAFAGLIVAGCKLTRAGYESARYTVLRKSGPFEIREYPSLTVVSTPMADIRGRDGSFMRLFQYISGENQGGQKIAMTTPVFMEQGGQEPQMSFVVPEKVAASGPPNASASDVLVETRAGGKFAVYRFSGSWNAKKIEAAQEKLLAWMQGEKLEPKGSPEIAGYDPPFIPGFLRRNEVLFRLE